MKRKFSVFHFFPFRTIDYLLSVVSSSFFLFIYYFKTLFQSSIRPRFFALKRLALENSMKFPFNPPPPTFFCNFFFSFLKKIREKVTNSSMQLMVQRFLISELVHPIEVWPLNFFTRWGCNKYNYCYWRELECQREKRETSRKLCVYSTELFLNGFFFFFKFFEGLWLLRGEEKLIKRRVKKV